MPSKFKKTPPLTRRLKCLLDQFYSRAKWRAYFRSYLNDINWENIVGQIESRAYNPIVKAVEAPKIKYASFYEIESLFDHVRQLRRRRELQVACRQLGQLWFECWSAKMWFNIFGDFYESYFELMERWADPRTSRWFLMSSPIPVFFISIGYLLVVLVRITKIKQRSRLHE